MLELVRVGAAAVVMLVMAGGAFAPAARAGCFERGIGCTDDHFIATIALRNLSCGDLWYLRNSVYDDNGYCFSSTRGRRNFDNAGCWIDNQNVVRLNNYERQNVARIKRIERENGCR